MKTSNDSSPLRTTRVSNYMDIRAFFDTCAVQLGSVADASIDVAFSVGALEHMLDKGRVIASVFRVLRPGGRFICLTRTVISYGIGGWHRCAVWRRGTCL